MEINYRNYRCKMPDGSYLAPVEQRELDGRISIPPTFYFETSKLRSWIKWFIGQQYDPNVLVEREREPGKWETVFYFPSSRLPQTSDFESRYRFEIEKACSALEVDFIS